MNGPQTEAAGFNFCLAPTVFLRGLLHPQLLKMCLICSVVFKKGLGFLEVCKTGHKLLVQPFKSLIQGDKAREIAISSSFRSFLVQ